MALNDIRREHVLQAIEKCDECGRDEFLEKYGFRDARNIWLVHDGRSYDSKAIIGVAHSYARPDLDPLTSSDFSGGETVKQSGLVQVILHPLRFETQVGFALGLDIQCVLLAKDFHLFTKHPGEGHYSGGVGWMAQGSSFEMTVKGLGAAVVGMVGLADILKG